MSFKNISLSLKTGKIDGFISHNKKAKNAQILIEFNSSESELLDELLIRFKSEKVFEVGTNANNAIVNCWVSNNAIYLIVPDTYILKVTALVYMYLLASKISAVAARDCISKEQSYKKLHSDVQKGFKITITGKCISLLRKIEAKDKSISAFTSALDKAKVRDFPDVKAPKRTEEWIKSFDIAVSDTAKLYMCIFLGKFVFKISGNKLLTDECTYMNMKHHLLEHADIAQAHIKAFLGQCGAKRSKPAANDSNGSKMKAANEEALRNLNVILGMIAILHGLKFSNLSQSSWELNKEALAEMKKMLK